MMLLLLDTLTGGNKRDDNKTAIVPPIQSANVRLDDNVFSD